MKKLILAAAMLAAASPALAQDIGGAYKVQGTNHDGSPYSGDALITLTSDTTCEIVWNTGGVTSKGICSRNDDAFAAAYVLNDSIGLVIYKVQADGSMQGLWTIAGEGGSGTEVLTPN